MYRPVIMFIFIFFSVHLQGGVYAQDATSEGDPYTEEDSSFKDEIFLNDYIMMPETLLQRIQAHKKDFVLYDLREPYLYAQGHVRGARQCTWHDGNFKRKSRDFALDKDIIVISRNGGNGIRAVKFLLNRDFTRIYSIEGGMENWLYSKYLEY